MHEFIAGVVVCYCVLYISGTLKMRRLLAEELNNERR